MLRLVLPPPLRDLPPTGETVHFTKPPFRLCFCFNTATVFETAALLLPSPSTFFAKRKALSHISRAAAPSRSGKEFTGAGVAFPATKRATRRERLPPQIENFAGSPANFLLAFSCLSATAKRWALHVPSAAAALSRRFLTFWTSRPKLYWTPASRLGFCFLGSYGLGLVLRLRDLLLTDCGCCWSWKLKWARPQLSLRRAPSEVVAELASWRGDARGNCLNHFPFLEPYSGVAGLKGSQMWATPLSTRAGHLVWHLWTSSAPR